MHKVIKPIPDWALFWGGEIVCELESHGAKNLPPTMHESLAIYYRFICANSYYHDKQGQPLQAICISLCKEIITLFGDIHPYTVDDIFSIAVRLGPHNMNLANSLILTELRQHRSTNPGKQNEIIKNAALPLLVHNKASFEDLFQAVQQRRNEQKVHSIFNKHFKYFQSALNVASHSCRGVRSHYEERSLGGYSSRDVSPHP